VLKEVESHVNRPLCEHFDLIFGTSNGSIIAALLGLATSLKWLKSRGDVTNALRRVLPTLVDIPAEPLMSRVRDLCRVHGLRPRHSRFTAKPTLLGKRSNRSVC
jgi:hypothetical protein